MQNIDENTMRISLKKEIDDSYNLVFGENLFPKIASDLKKEHSDKKIAIVTDSNVHRLYGNSLEGILKDYSLDVNLFSFPAGEQSKKATTCLQIIDDMSGLKYGRDSTILALGGGVVGDMTGWIAANFLRGVLYWQIPTTILSQADSSVGGKTGVDTVKGKNLVGAFYQPLRVYLDIATLQTLKDIEVRNGLVESVKHGVIKDADYFEYLELNVNALLAKDPSALMHIAKQNCRIKGEVVEIDTEEKGLRRILNYGHTIGHAVEKLGNYKIPHGGCVSMGMMPAGRIAVKYGFPEEDLERQMNLLARIGTPILLPSNITNDDIIEVTAVDKKAKAGMARYCLPKRIGEMNDFNGQYATYVGKEIVLEAMQKSR